MGQHPARKTPPISITPVQDNSHSSQVISVISPYGWVLAESEHTLSSPNQTDPPALSVNLNESLISSSCALIIPFRWGKKHCIINFELSA